MGRNPAYLCANLFFGECDKTSKNGSIKLNETVSFLGYNLIKFNIGFCVK